MIASNLDHLVRLYNQQRLPASLTRMALIAKRQLEAAEKLRTQGLAASAYDRIVDAWIYAASATSTEEILELVQSGDLAAAQAKLAGFEALAASPRRSSRRSARSSPRPWAATSA